MKDPLHNPVYNALLSGDAHFALGTGSTRYFPEEVSPFAGFPHETVNGFQELFEQLPPGRAILYATPQKTENYGGWKLLAAVEGLQFVYQRREELSPMLPGVKMQLLGTEHVQEMMALAALTKPGPFASRTIEFGHYYGIYQEGKLAAMTGQRLHVNEYAEISAVCTHPDHLGKGYAAKLLSHQVNLILRQNKIPFLHVRADNVRAIAIYERLGFEISRPMHFYFLRRPA